MITKQALENQELLYVTSLNETLLMLVKGVWVSLSVPDRFLVEQCIENTTKIITELNVMSKAYAEQNKSDS